MGLAGVVAVVVLSAGQPSQPKKVADCGKYRIDRVVTINSNAFNTEVASSAAEFEKGLAGRPCILPNQAMLFAFKQPGQYPFWMRGMKFPIDMLWINSNDQVTAARANIQPSTYPQQFANAVDHPAQYVLEIKANRAIQLKVGLGTPVSF
ncbi:MAG TPA: DUF192 domain-containing protein [Candidatus Saccharimonadales bacterium]|nr:DUF192 domain-containing protein [Candidatus Saccharimonadales bacterium]